MGDILQLSRVLPLANRTVVTIHCAPDGSAVVTLRPAVPGLPARREFAMYDEAWSWADQVARHHTRIECRDGSYSHSVIIAGPEGSGDA